MLSAVSSKLLSMGGTKTSMKVRLDRRRSPVKMYRLRATMLCDMSRVKNGNNEAADAEVIGTQGQSPADGRPNLPLTEGD